MFLQIFLLKPPFQVLLYKFFGLIKLNTQIFRINKLDTPARLLLHIKPIQLELHPIFERKHNSSRNYAVGHCPIKDFLLIFRYKAGTFPRYPVQELQQKCIRQKCTSESASRPRGSRDSKTHCTIKAGLNKLIDDFSRTKVTK